MNTLYDALMQGETEYRDGGVIIQHPPTATALRAARTIMNQSNINANYSELVQQLQLRVEQYLTEIQTLRDYISKNEQVQSICKDSEYGGSSDVGSDSGVS